MSTATQLLERCKEHITHSVWSNPELIKDIEAYLAKQQVEQEPIGTVRQANGCTYVEWNHVPPEAGTVCYAAPQATKQGEQEPIYKYKSAKTIYAKNTPLYTSPQAREPMSDEDVSGLWIWSASREAELTATTQQHAFARAIEAHHGIK